jgi:hypothetical protein
MHVWAKWNPRSIMVWCTVLGHDTAITCLSQTLHKLTCPQIRIFPLNVSILQCTGKKGDPKQTRCSPERSRRFSLPDFHDILQMKVVWSSGLRTDRLNPQEIFLIFSLGDESTTRPWYGRNKYVTEKCIDTTGNRSRDNPTSCEAPYPLLHFRHMAQRVPGN